VIQVSVAPANHVANAPPGLYLQTNLNVKHPLDAYLFLDFCQRNELDPAEVEDWQDPNGEGWMPEGLAAEMEQVSDGAIPRSCWPRLRPEQRLKELRKAPPVPKVATKPQPLPEGRQPNRPDFPLRVWLRKRRPPRNVHAFSKEENIAHQRISFYENGLRAITMELAKRWERLSDGAVPWTCWPLVRRPGPPRQFWSYGKPVTPEEAARIRELAEAGKLPAK
jgi:hypothetical protein